MASDKLRFVITDYGFPNVDPERQIVHSVGGELATFQCKTEEDVIQAAKDADAILVQWAPITQRAIQALLRCRVIVRYGIGVDNVDLNAARERGIIVCNVPDYCIDEVADHTFALAIALARQLPMADRLLKEGIWNTVPARPMAASRQMIFGTIGYGRTARAVLDRARGFKFDLATCDPYVTDNGEPVGDVKWLDMNTLLTTADIISLHTPLTRETRHMVDEVALSKMKSTSLLINTARGGLVDTIALAHALNRSEIAGAGIDVFESEPLPEDHPLRRCPTAILTSHIAWYSELSVPTLQRSAIEEAVRALKSGQPRSRIA